MADDLDARFQAKLDEQFQQKLDTQTRDESGAEPGSPLARALAEQPGDVVTVTDPQEGELGKFTRKGQPFRDSADMRTEFDPTMDLDTQNALRSFLSGGGPFLDELAGMKAVTGGGANVVKRALGGDFQAQNPLDTYRKARDTERRESAIAQRDFPVTAIAGQVATSLPAGFIGGGMGLGGRMLASAGAQAAAAGENELGASNLDVTRGEGGDLARRVLEEMATGGAIGAGGELGASALGAASKFLGNKAAAATDVLRAQIQRAKDKAVNSARGALGGVVAGQNNIADTLRDVLSRPQFFEQPTVDAANRAVSSAEGKTLMNRSVMNNIEKLGDALTREGPARGAFQDALAAAQAPQVESEVAQRLGNVGGDLANKAMSSIGQRAALGMLGGGVGWLLGDTAGAGLGAGLGAGMAPGALQFMRNAVKNPANQAVAFRAGESLLGGSQAIPRVGAIAGDVMTRENPNRVGYESLISKWLKPGAPQDVVQEAQGVADEQSRRNFTNSTNGTKPQKEAQ